MLVVAGLAETVHGQAATHLLASEAADVSVHVGLAILAAPADRVWVLVALR